MKTTGNLILMATPVDYTEMGAMVAAMQEGRLDPDDLIDETGNVPADGNGDNVYDVVIQVANNAAVPEGLTMLRGGGRYLHIGAGGNGAIPVESMPQQMDFYHVRSSEPRHWLQAIDFLSTRQGRFPFDDMISRTYKLEEINAAMGAMDRYEVVKAAIAFS